ncbi:hypothetical protein BDZ89DRAFT_1133710 [Hymenopellis radicata]|nr:hypothetical protein BDZ89DRAFT_1133710 [Hymenopellis radicata]
MAQTNSRVSQQAAFGAALPCCLTLAIRRGSWILFAAPVHTGSFSGLDPFYSADCADRVATHSACTAYLVAKSPATTAAASSPSYLYNRHYPSPDRDTYRTTHSPISAAVQSSRLSLPAIFDTSRPMTDGLVQDNHMVPQHRHRFEDQALRRPTTRLLGRERPSIAGLKNPRWSPRKCHSGNGELGSECVREENLSRPNDPGMLGAIEQHGSLDALTNDSRASETLPRCTRL